MPRQKNTNEQLGEEQSTPLYTAAMRFQDATGLKAPKREDGEDSGPLFYEIGEDVSHLDQARLDMGLQYGIIKKNEPQEATPVTQTGNQQPETPSE